MPVRDSAGSGYSGSLSRRVAARSEHGAPSWLWPRSRLYPEIGTLFATHETVKHSADEYVRGDVHTNSAEGYFSIFKRGMRGVYQHCGEKHLHRYLAEYDFRYYNRSTLGIEDRERAALAIQNVTGKRLTYRQPD